jgi:hypothetical protein
MSITQSEIHVLRDCETPGDVLPHRVALALTEFCRLAEEASNYLSRGSLFPGLSSLTGLKPVLGTLIDFCVARVVPTEDSDEPEKAFQNKPPVGFHPGIYL